MACNLFQRDDVSEDFGRLLGARKKTAHKMWSLTLIVNTGRVDRNATAVDELCALSEKREFSEEIECAWLLGANNEGSPY